MAKHQNNRPVYEGKFMPGNDVVKNPYHSDDPDAEPYNDTGRNYAESPSAMMLKRGDIDAAQERADGKFRRLYEASQGGKSLASSTRRMNLWTTHAVPLMASLKDAGRQLLSYTR